MGIRMSPNRANRITDPRLLAALPDPRVTAIAEAVRRCEPAGYRRENWMYGRTKGAETLVALLDELSLTPGNGENICALGETLRDVCYQTVYQGTAVPAETLGEALALDAVAEGEVRRDAAKLIDAPKCPSRKRSLLQTVTYEIGRSELVRRVLLRDLRDASESAR